MSLYKCLAALGRQAHTSNLNRVDKNTKQIKESKEKERTKNKRKGESDSHWVKRLKRYGFTKDGVHIKTGINYQLSIETEESKMSVDIKNKLKELEGETFYTKKRIPFAYKIIS